MDTPPYTDTTDREGQADSNSRATCVMSRFARDV
jgi:hypothetical protein